MNRKMHIIPVLVAIALIWSTVTASAWQGAAPAAPMAALGNSFTYQGYLTNSAGTPVHDICDFRFSLYSVATGGTRIGVSNDISNVQVDHGRFTVTLNAADEFGSQPFAGSERYLSILVVCDNGGPEALLSPRQPLRAAPYALYAQNVGAHNHLGEVWTSSAVGAGSGLTIDNSSSLSGIGLTVEGGPLGLAVDAQGPIHSSATTTMYINPQTMVVRHDSTSTTVYADSGGAMTILLPQSTAVKYVMVPVQIYGTLTGSKMYVDSIEVCHDAGNGQITTTAVVKNNGTIGGESFYILDSTNHGADVYTCYTATATKPRLPVDNTTWIQFNVYNPMPAPSASVTIHKIKLNLVEDAN